MFVPGGQAIPTSPPSIPPPAAPERPRSLRGPAKRIAYGALLAGISFLGPLVAYAGVSVIYPAGQQTVNVDTAPPITFAAGGDHSRAQTIGFSSAFSTANNAAAMTLTLSGLSGGTVTIDKLANITRESSVASYKVQVAVALSGTLTNPDALKIRLWRGSTAPTADNSAGVCAVLDLEAAVNTESTASCTGAGVDVQLVYQLPSGSSGSSTVSIRPSSITFA